jgi:hypothetical protein
MSVSNYKELGAHVGHEIQCVRYGKKTQGISNVAVECMDCNIVLIDFDKEDEDDEEVCKHSSVECCDCGRVINN